jgi:acyl-CoA reductase-like NAD-dependent aldehyde dehydrogenase
MIQFQIYSAGKFTSTKQVLKVTNPYTGEEFAETWLAGKTELEASIEKALSVKEAMKVLPSFKRFEILKTISEGLHKDREEFALLLCRESGKPMKYALGEIDRAAQTFLVAAEEAKRLPGEVLSVDWTPAGGGKEGFVKYFPVGLIAGIAPFNFPMNLAVHKIAPAIASGNCIILKPARSTPLSVLKLAQLIDKTELPKGAVSILPMDRESGNQLVTDERFKMLSFTGSPDVGWKMKAAAGRKKIALELGGNAGVIVSETADMQNAIEKCLVGGYAYSGQVCIHVQRIFVHESIFEAFSEQLATKVNKLKSGNPELPDTDISVMIDKENALRVEEWVNEAIAGEAKILAGGKREGSYYKPTLITNTRQEMKVCSNEIFGPVVSIEPFKTFKEAVQILNDSRYGLQAGVFTNSLEEYNYAVQHIEVGGLIINDVPSFRVDHMPYGGVKDSGQGREGIKYAIHEMMEPKLIIKNTL